MMKYFVVAEICSVTNSMLSSSATGYVAQQLMNMHVVTSL